MRPTCQRCNARTVTKAGTKSNGDVRWRHICGPCEGVLRKIRSSQATQDAVDLVKLQHDEQISLMNDAVDKLGNEINKLRAWAGVARPHIGILEDQLDQAREIRLTDEEKLMDLEVRLAQNLVEWNLDKDRIEDFESELDDAANRVIELTDEIRGLEMAQASKDSQLDSLQRLNEQILKDRNDSVKTASAQLIAYRSLNERYGKTLSRLGDEELKVADAVAEIQKAKKYIKIMKLNAMTMIEGLAENRNRQDETINQMTNQHIKLKVKVDALQQDAVEMEGVAESLRDALVLAETAKLEALEEADQCHQKEIDLYIKDQKIAHDAASEATRQWMLARSKMRVAAFLYGLTLMSLISTLYFLAL